MGELSDCVGLIFEQMEVLMIYGLCKCIEP